MSDSEPRNSDYTPELRLESKQNALMMVIRQRDQLEEALTLSKALCKDLSAEVKRLKAERELPPMLGGWY